MVKSVYDIIVSPIVTEKSTMVAEQGKIILQVAVDANKSQIARAFEEIYKVKPLAVNTINVSGKTKRFKGVKGRRKDTKKAIITLGENVAIDLASAIK